MSSSADRRLRIAFLIDSVGNSAGTENQVIALLRSIDRSRFELHLCCLESSPNLAELSAVCHVVVFPLHSVFSPGGLKQCLRLRSYINRNRIDVLHTFMLRSNIAGVLAASWSHCRAIVASRRNLGYALTPGLLQLFRTLNSLTTRLLANSEAARQAAAAIERVDPAKIDVLYNGVHTPAYVRTGSEAETQTRRLFGIPDEAKVVGIVANLRPVKDHDLFLRAAQQIASAVPDAVFLLVGTGPLREELGRLADTLGIGGKVFFTEGRASVASCLHIMSVGCLTSVSEGFSNAILEYMAAGLPVVATDVGGNREAVLDGETGFIVSGREPAAFAQPVIRLLSDESARLEMGHAGSRRCEEMFSMPRAVALHEAYYRRLVGSSS